ncbi:MAG: peptidase M75 [Bacteroidales bacterium]|jgi:uncharacterized iron-regulated protein|nr:peptidase M75 [Bacteroidales bacterium]
MKKHITLLLSAILAISLTSCERTVPVEDDRDQEYLSILASYVDNTVIVTYKNMADNAVQLYALCEELNEDLTDAKVAQAANKWKETRSFWEKSEAFLFGPAEYSSLDPHLDSWPLDKGALDQVLARADVLDIDGEYARNNFGASLVGFHAIEYVLFRDGQPRPASSITPEELVYLRAIAQVLAEDCILLEGGWRGVDELTDEKKQIIEDAELSISTNFGFEMKNAGKAGSRYSTPRAGIEEIIEGCMAIADEVGNAKITDPVSSQDVLQVESWYSWNSITDFVNNIESIENSYLGSVDGLQDASLSSFLAKNNPDLDAEIKANISKAKEKIRAIGEPFRNHLDNLEGAQAAITACDDLNISLSKISNIL